MTYKKKCLFLGYNEKKTILIDFLERSGVDVVHTSDHLTMSNVETFDIIISFGYTKLINVNFLKKLKRPPVNLHMSFLPFNRGAHPNFWSFVENTPKGITIHEISKGVDDGDIIFQKKFKLDPSLEKFSTFKKTYNYLFNALENLFIENFEKIINYNYSTKRQGKFFTFHLSKALPKNLIDWDTNILKYLNNRDQI